jgi:hypothetical protein
MKTRDFNDDGVTATELYSDIATVQNTYESDRVVTLGAKSVRLILRSGRRRAYRDVLARRALRK